MSTLNITTSAYSGSNRIRVDLYLATAPNTVIDSKGPITGPAASTLWTFIDLIPGDVYIFKVVEIDPSTSNVLQVLISDNVTTPSSGSIDYRAGENIIVDATPGLSSGTNTATFDGTSGKPDFRGWEIVPIEIGTGPLEKEADYHYNKTTGKFDLLRTDATFQSGVRYYILFEPRLIPVSNNVIVRDAWTTDLVVTDDITLSPSDINKNIIIKGNDGYLKITLPDIAATQKGLFNFDATEGSHKCIEITCNAGNTNKINWPSPGRNSLFMGRNETISVYRDNSGTLVWRVKYPEGNFKSVGEIVSEFTDPSDVINKVALDDSTYDKLEYARLYDYILNLPSSEVVTFGSWVTGDNRYKFSTADGSGLFHVPDLRNLYERQSGNDLPTTYQADMLLSHSHNIEYILEGNDGSPGAQVLKTNSGDTGSGPGQGGQGTNSWAVRPTGGAENRPKTIVVNKYMRC